MVEMDQQSIARLRLIIDNNYFPYLNHDARSNTEYINRDTKY